MRDFLYRKGWSYFESKLFMDAMRNLFYLSAFLIVFNLFFFCRYDISSNEWKVMAAWIKKDFYWEFMDIGWDKVTYQGEYFKWHVSKKFIMKDQYVLAIVAKFKSCLLRTILLALVSIISSGVIILLCFSYSFIENRRLQDQLESFKKRYLEDEKELKSAIEKLKAELNSIPKIQSSPATPIRARDLGNGKGSV